MWGRGIIKLCTGYDKSEIPTRYSSSDFKKEAVIGIWNLGEQREIKGGVGSLGYTFGSRHRVEAI